MRPGEQAERTRATMTPAPREPRLGPAEYSLLGLLAVAGTEGVHGYDLQRHYTHGALGEITSSWGMKYSDAPALLHIHTPEACLVMTSAKIEAITEAGRETIFEVTEPPIPHGSALGECEHFLDCIAEGKTPLTSGEEAMVSHRAIWSIYNQNGVPSGV